MIKLGKKGMEMWQLILILLAILLLIFVLGWYSGLNTQLGGLLDRVGSYF